MIKETITRAKESAVKFVEDNKVQITIVGTIGAVSLWCLMPYLGGHEEPTGVEVPGDDYRRRDTGCVEKIVTAAFIAGVTAGISYLDSSHTVTSEQDADRLVGAEIDLNTDG